MEGGMRLHAHYSMPEGAWQAFSFDSMQPEAMLASSFTFRQRTVEA